MIKREKYLKKIRGFYDVDLIKVITGIRRCGKSILLKQIMEEIKERGVDEKQIIYLNLEYDDYDFIKNNKDLSKYLKSRLVEDKKNYLLIDEVENITGWEKTINSYKAKLGDNISIFLTDSNSNSLVSTLSNLITGRYVSFKVSPFSFNEVVLYYKEKGDSIDVDSIFEDYIKWGGFPQSLQFNDASDKKLYLTNIYNSIVQKDILKKYKIKDIDLLNKVLEYVISSPSKFLSAETILNYFKNDAKEISRETIYSYLDYMVEAFLINKAERYNSKDNKSSSNNYKYYSVDLGISNVVSKGNKVQISSCIDNIVYNELLARGYEVSVGSFLNDEVDFTATRYDEKIYIQTTYQLTNEDDIRRVFDSFDNINDDNPKYVLSMDKDDYSQKGIIHKNIIDWVCMDSEK